jgi:hypothetical protein
MTRLSRSLPIAPFALTLALAGCEHACGLDYCPAGLVITLDASFTGPGVYDIEIVDVPEMLGPVDCTFAPNGFPTDAGTFFGGGLRCASAFPHDEQDGMELVQDYQPKTIMITVRSEGVVVATKTFPLTFDTTEPNGAGCGTCTHALVTMSLN